MATREERIGGLESRVAVLEAAIASLVASGPTLTLRSGKPEPAFDKPRPRNPNPRWLDKAIYANGCATDRCSARIEKGQRCYFVPAMDTEKSKVYCEPCATALGH